ncbi:MAG: hypothetical protein KAR06_08020 [Deltaproteobacteria bacterium]|nr:hypothetical protein [Deltaproteobacteria bacterium]
MFDKTIVQTGPQKVYKETHEHRAPTDESVRLLKEMEAKALKSILGQFRVETNTLKGLVTAFAPQLETMDTVVIYQFNINGEKYEVREKVDKWAMNKDTIYKNLCDAVAKDLAYQFVQKTAMDMERPKP